ncbi:MAG: nitroreductase family protein [Candidatus Aenigmatarchaeota archaeon]
MSVIETIKKRRSIRKFKRKEVPEYIIKKILNAARLAPSGNNAQPSNYIIIKDKKTKEMLKKNKIFVQNLVYDVPLIIACCANPDAYPKTKFIEGVDDPNVARALRDLSIASSYLVLAATELGLGCCYIGWMNKKKAKRVLGIPKNFIFPYVIICGYPNEKRKRSKKKSLKEILHHEKWWYDKGATC